MVVEFPIFSHSFNTICMVVPRAAALTGQKEAPIIATRCCATAVANSSVSPLSSCGFSALSLRDR